MELPSKHSLHYSVCLGTAQSCGGHSVSVMELQNPVTIIHYTLTALYSVLRFSLLDGCLKSILVST